MENRQIDKKKTMQVRMDTHVHKEAKVFASKLGRTLQSLTEELWLRQLEKGGEE